MLNRKLIVAFVASVGLFFGIYSFAQTGDNEAPVITLKGDAKQTIEVGSKYVEKGATAIDDDDTDLTDEIIIDGKVDENKVGTYKITYNVSDSAGNDAEEVVRTVYVVDTTSPVITLNGQANMIVRVHSNYVDAGVTVIDNYDKDIVDKVSSVSNVNTNIVGVYTVTYDVTDSEGNVAQTVVRTVNVVDTTAPIITLLGAEDLTIEVGSTYTDAGATARDNYDNDITNLIVATGSVDPNKLGAYTITYDVTDSNGNAAQSVVRTVNVVDSTSPVIDVDYSNEVITKDDVTVTITSNEPLQPLTDWTLSTDKLTLTKVFESNVVQSVTVKDLYDNETDVNIKIENIDKVAPIFDGLIHKGHTTGDITINVIDDNLDSIKVYNQDINKTFTKNNGDVLTEEATYKLTATDKAGNETIIWVAIDRTDSTISGVTDNETYNHDVIVKVFDKFLMTVTVNKDGTITTYERNQFNSDSKDENYGIELPISEDGVYTIIGTDKVGKRNEVTFVIDKIAPEVTVNYISNKSKLIEYNKKSDRVAIEFKTNEPIDLTTSVVTIAGQTATLDTDKKYTSSEPYIYTYEIIVDDDTPEGQVTFVLNIKDLAGNQTPTITITEKNKAKIIIDKTLPQVVSFNQEYDESEGAIKVTIQYSEPVTGFTVSNSAWRDLGNNTYYTYYKSTQDVTINFEDSAKNANSFNFIVDNDAPAIDFDGSNYSNTYRPQHRRKVTVSDALNGVDASSLKYIWTTDKNIAIDASGFASFTNGTDLYSPLEATGIHYLVIVAKDNVGNIAVHRSNGFKLDNSKPNITFGTDGNSTSAKLHSTTISASDEESGINYIKYLWKTSNTAPDFDEINNSGTPITSGGIVNTPSGENGEYYLWVLAVSKSELAADGYDYEVPSNIYAIKGSQAFALDNGAPTFNIFDALVYVDLDTTYVDVKPTAIDSVDNDVTVTSSGNIDTSTAGIYTITYTATDDAGNTATATRLVYVRPVITAPANANHEVGELFTAPMASLKVSATVIEDLTYSSSEGNLDKDGNTFTLTYTATRNGVEATHKTTVITAVDSFDPEITITPNGNDALAKSYSPTVTATDRAGIKELRYAWSTSNTDLTAANITKPLINESSVPTPSGVAGVYYLWVYVVDESNKDSIKVSNGFNIDNNITNLEITNSTEGIIIFQSDYKTSFKVNYSDIPAGVDPKNVKYAKGSYTLTNFPTDAKTLPADKTIKGVGRGETYSVYIKDNVGNEKVVTKTCDNIFTPNEIATIGNLNVTVGSRVTTWFVFTFYHRMLNITAIGDTKIVAYAEKENTYDYKHLSSFTGVVANRDATSLEEKIERDGKDKHTIYVRDDKGKEYLIWIEINWGGID